MAIAEQAEILIETGVDGWNKWREENSQVTIDLIGLNLNDKELSGVNFNRAYLAGANFSGANLNNADLSFAHLNGANLSGANLDKANFCGAWLNSVNLELANLSGADFKESVLNDANFKGAVLKKASLMSAICLRTDFSYADLSEACVSCANFVEANLEQTILSDCNVYGLSAWNLQGNPKERPNLIITSPWNANESIITVDDLQVAQFIYLLLNNKTLRNVIETITSKAVLILGNFKSDRKAVLDALKEELRKRNYLPILFDFEASDKRDLPETISTLAHLAKFIIADITDAKSIPQELQLIVPNLPSVPVLPLLLSSQSEYGLFKHFPRYPWVLPTFNYTDTEEIIGSICEKIITPLEIKFGEQTRKDN